MLPGYVYYIIGFMVLWLGIHFGEKIPMLGLPDVDWIRSFFWALIIFFASQLVSIMLSSIG